jgi:hypothetical protein
MAARKFPSYLSSMILYLSPPPRKSNMSMDVTIPRSLPVPGSVIGSLLNLFLTIISAASFMVAVWGAVTTVFFAMLITSPSCSEACVSNSTGPRSIAFTKFIVSFLLINTPLVKDELDI